MIFPRWLILATATALLCFDVAAEISPAEIIRLMPACTVSRKRSGPVDEPRLPPFAIPNMPAQQKCSIKYLLPAGCSLKDMKSCYCTNQTLQEEVSVCVMNACTLAEQDSSYPNHGENAMYADIGPVTLQVSQHRICEGVPKPSHSHVIIVAVILLSVFTFPMVGLRLYSRRIAGQQLWWDDWMVVVGAVGETDTEKVNLVDIIRHSYSHSRYWQS